MAAVRVSYRNVTPLAGLSSSGNCNLWVISIPSILENTVHERDEEAESVRKKDVSEGRGPALLSLRWGKLNGALQRWGFAPSPCFPSNTGLSSCIHSTTFFCEDMVNNFHSGHLILSLSNTDKAEVGGSAITFLAAAHSCTWGVISMSVWTTKLVFTCSKPHVRA